MPSRPEILRPFARALLMAAGVGLFSSCAVYKAKPLDPAKSAARITTRRLEQGRTWALARLTELATAQHGEIAVAQAKLATAKAASITADTRPNPTAGFSPTITANPGDAISPWLFGFTLDVPFETAGKRSKRVAVALAEQQTAALEVSTARFKVVSALHKAFSELAAATHRSEALNTQLAAQEEIVKLYNARIAAGEGSRTDTMQSRLLLQQTRLLARDAQKQQAVAKADLAEAIGMSVEGLDGAKFDFNALDKASSAVPAKQLRAKALRNRTDLLAMLADYAVAEAKLRLEVAKQYPDVHLSPGYEFDQGANKWTLGGLSTALPVFDRNKGGIAEAEAKRELAGASFAALQAKVVGEVDHAAALHQGALQKLVEADALVAETAKQREATAQQVKAGGAGKLVTASAEVEHQAAVIARLEALAEVQAALVQLEQATQTPLITK